MTPHSRRLALSTGLTYHVLEWERPSDVTFLLVHGFTDLAWGWEGVAERLPGRVLAPDLRGHGDTDWIGAGGYYHFFDYVADLDEVIARMVPSGPLVVVGHSMGGSVCGYWAGTRPDKLVGLVLVEGLGPPDASMVDIPIRTSQWIEQWQRARKPGRVMATIDDAAARLCKYDPLLDRTLAKRIAEVGTREVAGGVTWKHDPMHMTMGPYPYRLDVAKQFWRRITCPVLCVDGGKSMMNLADGERASRRETFASCRHEVIAEAGHAVQRHQPARLAELISAWAAPRSADAVRG